MPATLGGYLSHCCPDDGHAARLAALAYKGGGQVFLEGEVDEPLDVRQGQARHLVVGEAEALVADLLVIAHDPGGGQGGVAGMAPQQRPNLVAHDAFESGVR